MLALAAVACDPAPAFEAAIPVPFGGSGGVEAKFDPTTRCLGAPPEATTYAVFRLPEAPPYTLTIYSRANGALIAPRATLYDATGHPGRILALPDFESGVGGLRAGLRTKGNERWLVVAADRTHLGDPVTLRLGTRTSGSVLASTIIIIPTAPVPDIVREQSAIYTLNGTIRVTAEPIVTVR